MPLELGAVPFIILVTTKARYRSTLGMETMEHGVLIQWHSLNNQTNGGTDYDIHLTMSVNMCRTGMNARTITVTVRQMIPRGQVHEPVRRMARGGGYLSHCEGTYVWPPVATGQQTAATLTSARWPQRQHRVPPSEEDLRLLFALLHFVKHPPDLCL